MGWCPGSIMHPIKHRVDIRDYRLVTNILKEMNAQFGDVVPPEAHLLFYRHSLHLLH